MLTSLVPILFTFYIQGVLKLKKNNSRAKGLNRLLTCIYAYGFLSQSQDQTKRFPCA